MNVIGKKCKRGYEVTVIKSSAGYYLGTVDEDGFPNCRISNGYMRSEKDVGKLVPDRVCEENLFCNGGTGCGICL